MEGKSLTARDLCKTYGKVRALDHVSLTLEPGHIYGLIGRNGAGKTTLLAALAAQIPLDEGQVAYGGAPGVGKRSRPGRPVFQPGTDRQAGGQHRRPAGEGLPESRAAVLPPTGTKPTPKNWYGCSGWRKRSA